MKKILFILLMLGLTLTSCERKNLYCGKVVEKYLLHKNNGGTHYVVFYSDSIKANINVGVTAFTYVNTKIGDNVCFSLSEYYVRQ